MDKEIKKAVKTLGVFSTIGMSMALAIALGTFIGYYIDKTFKTQPWFLLIFTCLGIAAAFRNLYILYKKADKL